MSRLLELEALAQDFANWRGSKAHRAAKTPPHLKAKALELAPYFKRNELYKALGIYPSTFVQWRRHKQDANNTLETLDTSLPYTRVDLSLISEPESTVLCDHNLTTKGSVDQKNKVLPLASLQCGRVSIEFFSTQALVAVCQQLSLGGEQ